MGKRSIGELPVFDFLVILVLGAVVGADIADPKIDHIHTVVAMIAIALLQKFIIFLKMRSRRIGKLLTFEPTVVIYDGKFLMRNMKKIKYSIDNILQMMREKDVFHMEDVEIAIIEANGNLSIKVVPMKEGVTREDLNIQKKGKNYEIPVILDGEIQADLLKRINKDEQWVRQKLVEQNVADITRVFYGAVNEEGKLHLSLKQTDLSNVPSIRH
ncbi:DUF421 domain-containing protein [Bacillus taeanensis]|uniref:DUF421 domain-containing protein n=2 Tax=Bacillus taeanensis TaxID=273032 RepID=A0A366XWL1_9BACI|nr:DUF421 domain-containing protein [Bacillus taeanensis]